jgi:hypothetical protein
MALGPYRKMTLGHPPLRVPPNIYNLRAYTEPRSQLRAYDPGRILHITIKKLHFLNELYHKS